MFKRHLMLSVSLVGCAVLPLPAYSQVFGLDHYGTPHCSADYNDTITAPGNGLEYGWQDTDGDSHPNSCVVRPVDFQQYGYAYNGSPFCSPSYSGSEVLGGDGNVYGWEDTSFNGWPNSCLVEYPSHPDDHAYGFADNGSPYCSPDYTGPEVLGGDADYGWEDTDHNDAKNSCVLMGASETFELAIANVTSPSGTHRSYPATNVIDGDTSFASRWANRHTPAILLFDLGSSKTVSDIDIAFGRGHKRTHDFEILASDFSDSGFVSIFDGQSSGVTTDYENFDFSETNARYIKLKVTSNSVGTRWTNITDVKVNSLQDPNSHQLKISGVTSPSGTHRSYPTTNVIDGDTSFASRWANRYTPAILLFDLGSSKNVSDIDIAFGQGNKRTHDFEILASDFSDSGFVSIFDGQSSGVTTDYENFDFSETNARYIKLKVTSNSVGTKWTNITDVKVNGTHDETTEDQNPSGLTHFGEPIVLNGANVAWNSYGADVGDTESAAEELRSNFKAIKDAGGNSARWWLHASGWFTPNIDDAGFVSGISTLTDEGISDEVVIDQVREILDVAWEEGIVLNIALLSFEMACSANNTEDGLVYRGEQFDQMLNNNPDSYIDNVLAPLVSGLKDHPALFAWEVFNEADGMTEDIDFFAEHCSNGSFPQELSTLQSFVNKSAAKIHELDKNVKVTTSVSQPAWLNQYTNEALTSVEGADPTGTLDFYQTHYYWLFDHPSSPYSISASDRALDRPIVVGEFGYGVVPDTNTSNEELSSALLENGYVGSWIWDQNSLTADQVETVITGAASSSPEIDKTAVEACISSQSSDCYND